MTSIKKDDHKTQWENADETEFPLVCETCLGDNPYVRMTKEPHGKPCTICETPFTVFAWQAGTRGRLKRVEVCKKCARAKNVCQVCIYDLQYGLPVKVRDRILAEGGSLNAGGGNALGMAIPQSDANRSWFNATNERTLSSNDGAATNVVDPMAAAKLRSMARMEPRYERNLPKLCSFFAKGECNRGSKCPFRHELPKDRNDPLAKQNTRDRFYGTNDPVANVMLGKRKDRNNGKNKNDTTKSKQEEKEKEEEGDERAISTIYVRYDNRDPSTLSLIPTELNVRDSFYSYGEITSVRMHEDKGAFVEYTTGDAARLAIASMDRKEVGGRMCLVSWARQRKRGDLVKRRMEEQDRIVGGVGSSSGGGGVGVGGGSGSVGPIRPMTPPGSGSVSENVNKKFRCLPIPSGFLPSPAVAAAAAARVAASTGLGATGIDDPNANTTTTSGVPRPGGGASGVPRPGGGVIRRAGQGLSGGRSAAPKPYYPSADPGRLGSRSSVTGAGN